MLQILLLQLDKPCGNTFRVAHTINLIVQSLLNTIKPIRLKVKAIVNFFRQNSLAAKKLKQMQKQLEMPQLKIKQGVVTRWNSTTDKRIYKFILYSFNCDCTYDMFRRILDIKEPLMSVVAVHYQNIDNLTNNDIITLEKCLFLKYLKTSSTKLVRKKR